MQSDAGAFASMGPRDYVDVLKRWKWVVALAVAVVVAAGVARSLSTEETYRATAQVLLPTGAETSRAEIATQIEIMTSEEIRSIVREELPRATAVTVRQVGESNTVELAAEAPDPDLAAASANALADAYIEFRNEQRLDGFVATTSALQARNVELQAEIDELSAELERRKEELRTQFAPPALESSSDAERREAELAQQMRELETLLGTRRNALIDQQLRLEQRMRDLELDSSVSTGGGRVLTAAAPSTAPVSPDPVSDGLTALGLGLLLGIVLAFVFEYLDDSVTTKEQLERVAGGVPVVGMIPTVPSARRHAEPEVVSISAPRSAAAEAYRSLRTATSFLGLDKGMETLQVTSPSAMDGKTTTVANLGVALSTAGRRVVLVDCDLRRPRLHHFFGLDDDRGLTSVLLGECAVEDAIERVPGIPRLSILRSGPIPPNPSELLSSHRFEQVLPQLRSGNRLVVLDSPALLPVTDAAVLAPRADALLLVVSAGGSSKDVARAIEILRRIDAPLVGSVLNDLNPADAGFFEYYDQRTKRERRHENGRRRRRRAAEPSAPVPQGEAPPPVVASTPKSFIAYSRGGGDQPDALE